MQSFSKDDGKGSSSMVYFDASEQCVFFAESFDGFHDEIQ